MPADVCKQGSPSMSALEMILTSARGLKWRLQAWQQFLKKKKKTESLEASPAIALKSDPDISDFWAWNISKSTRTKWAQFYSSDKKRY